MKSKSYIQMYMYVKRIDQETIAKQIGIDRSTVSRWLKNPTADHYQKIMDAIDQIEKERGEKEIDLSWISSDSLINELKKRGIL